MKMVSSFIVHLQISILKTKDPSRRVVWRTAGQMSVLV